MAIYVGIAVICTTVLALVAVPVMTLGLWLEALEEQFLRARPFCVAQELPTL